MKMQDKSKQILSSMLAVALCYSSIASAQSRKATPAKALKASASVSKNTKKKADLSSLYSSKNQSKGTRVAMNELSPVQNVASIQTQTSVAQLPQPEALSESPKRLSIITGVEYSEKIAVEEQGQRQSSTSYILALGYKTSDLTNVTAKAVLSQDNYAQHETTLSNTQIVVGIKGYTFNDSLSSAHSISGIIPTSEASQKTDRLKGGVSLSNGLTYVNPYITANYRLGLSKNFHEFNVNADGKPNIEYTLSNTLGVDVPVYGGFHVSAEGVYRNGRTYGGFNRYSFGFSADLNYDITKNFAVNLGTSNDGSALKSNGVDSNIAAYDAKSSVIRAGLGYAY